MLLQRKKANSFVPAIFFPHCMAFLEKRGGLVPVYVFLFLATVPVSGSWATLQVDSDCVCASNQMECFSGDSLGTMAENSVLHSEKDQGATRLGATGLRGSQRKICL